VVSLELRSTVIPEGGAGEDRFRVAFWTVPPAIVNVDGEKLTVAPTRTETLAGL
jgi:hypothetical protein